MSQHVQYINNVAVFISLQFVASVCLTVQVKRCEIWWPLLCSSAVRLGGTSVLSYLTFGRHRHNFFLFFWFTVRQQFYALRSSRHILAIAFDESAQEVILGMDWMPQLTSFIINISWHYSSSGQGLMLMVMDYQTGKRIQRFKDTLVKVSGGIRQSILTFILHKTHILFAVNIQNVKGDRTEIRKLISGWPKARFSNPIGHTITFYEW